MTDEKRFDEQMAKTYDHMLDQLAELFTQDGVFDAIEQSAEKASNLVELSREEVDKVADYLRRDLHDAATFMSESGKQLSDWLHFDLELVEKEMMNRFAKAADRTKLELDQLNYDLEAALHYKTGQITGIGTLECEACGHTLHYHKTGRIPPCPTCHKTAFVRISEQS